jgi:hypothetical protein
MSGPDRRADRLAQVQAQIDYHGQRLQLYQRLYGSHPCARLADLERAYAAVRERLARAAPPVGAPPAEAGVRRTGDGASTAA